MNQVISIENLGKTYQAHQVLSNLNWQVHAGDVIGLLGKNGAGKSTLIKTILNIDPIEQGSIEVFGQSHLALSSELKNKIGYVPQENDEIPWLSVIDLIKFRKRFYSQWSDEKVDELIARWEIDSSKKVNELSPGQMQKVLIILALAPLPKLLLLDEPAAALDPIARRAFLKELVELACEAEMTIIFSTHITSDVERVANKVAVLDKGRICYFDELDNFKEGVLNLSLTHDPALELSIPHVLRSQQNAGYTDCIVSALDSQWLAQLDSQGVKYQVTPLGLEDIFMELTR